MKIYEKKNHFMLRGVLALLLACLFTIPLHNVSAAVMDNGAKTSPPPIEVGSMGTFDPNHQYLEDGYSIINSLGDGEIEIVGVTKGTGYVNLLGIEITLQKWTGTDWINMYTSPSYTDTTVRIFDVSINRTVDTGYYYRVISTHWAEEGSVHEQGERTGNSELIN